jgi:hypothetical protein
MSKRQHHDLELATYVCPPPGFRLVRTFRNNPRVICGLWLRKSTAIPRHLRIPGCWWGNCHVADRRRKFDVVVTKYEKETGIYTGLVECDSTEVKLTKAALLLYRAPKDQ